MTPQEKAQELVDKMTDEIPSNNSKDMMTFIEVDLQASKQCALIAVDEILNLYWLHDKKGFDYWNQVKYEIEKI